MLNPHRCQLTDETSRRMRKHTGFFTFVKSWTTIYEDHPKCHQYLITLATVNKEKLRSRNRRAWWIIHPFSKLRLFWEIFMTIVYVVAFLTIPFFICFQVLDYQKISLDPFNPLIYAICWMDIFGHCITGYYDENNNEFVMNQASILKRYVRGFMLLDIISSIPYDMITFKWRQEVFADYTFAITTISLLPLLKLARYITFTTYLQQIFLLFKNEDILCQLLLTVMFYLYVVHWFSCLCNLIPFAMSRTTTVQRYNEDWMNSLTSYQKIGERYQRAIFIVIENFTGSGYGGIKPENDVHIAMCTLLMILGRLFESYIIIMLLQIVSDRKASASKYEEIINQLFAYGRQKQLPAYMKRRLLAYYHYRFRNSYFREKKILSNLSDSLRQEVILHSCRRLVENVEIFHELPKNILMLIVTHLKPELYLAKDMIIKAGTQGDCMFFLSSGTVAVLTPTGKEVCALEDGAHFGEVALLVQDQRRVASIVAVDVCEVYRLDRKDFRKCIAVHSDLFAKMEHIATERMQRTVVIEEQHKRFTMHTRSSNPPAGTDQRSSSVKKNKPAPMGYENE